MKSFIAAALAMTVMAGKKDNPGRRLYNCIDAHGDNSGSVSLLELAMTLEAAVDHGVIPERVGQSFLDNADLTDVLEPHMTEEDKKECAGGDDTVMAGELVACVTDALDGADDKEREAMEKEIEGAMSAV